MIKVYIFADSYKIYNTAIKEYQKRLGKELGIIILKPFKNKNSSLVIEKETHILQEVLHKTHGYKIILSPEGMSFDTQKFYKYIEIKKQNYGDIHFFIGGANGLDYKKLQPFSDAQISLSDFTFPHSLALLILIEQIYRLSMIKKGTKYNK